MSRQVAVGVKMAECGNNCLRSIGKHYCKVTMENKTVKRPDPAELLRQALTAPKYPELTPYIKVVYALRSEGMSWRNIASWLTERGIDVSHTTVRDFYNNEITRTPEPVWQAMIDEVAQESEHLMLPACPIDDDEEGGNNDVG